MQVAQQRMKRLLRKTKDCKWICAILILLTIAVLLVVWVFQFDGKMP